MYSKHVFAAGLFLSLVAVVSQARPQDPPPQSQGQDAPPAGQRDRRNDRGDERGQPLAGKINAINNGTIELTKPDGTTATVKLNDKTEFRKDRQPAKLADFKVGDLVFVRAEENADHTVSAAMIASRSGLRAEGGGRGPGGGGLLGELGKDYVAGEIKSVDAPKLTVMRSDKVTQTFELNEETSLRKGRESITMADIQPGDHVIARGGLQSNVFVPKNVVILSAEQWQRLQELGAGRGGSATAAPANAPPVAPKSNPQQ